MLAAAGRAVGGELGPLEELLEAMETMVTAAEEEEDAARWAVALETVLWV